MELRERVDVIKKCRKKLEVEGELINNESGYLIQIKARGNSIEIRKYNY